MKVKKISQHIGGASKALFANRIIANIIIPGILLLIGFGLSVFSSLTHNASYTILPYEHKSSYTISPSQGELYAKQTIKGEFKAEENNLGAVAVRLHNYNKEHEEIGILKKQDDTIVFRLKEKNDQKWIYEQKYSGGQFLELVHFPFGFPPITNSQGKNYQFEIISLNGQKGNALTLTDKQPIIVSLYQFNKGELVSNTPLLTHFIIQKVLYAFSHIEFYLIVFIFLLPFIFYYLWRTFLGEIISKYYNRQTKKISKSTAQVTGLKVLGRAIEELTIFDVLIGLCLLFDILFIENLNILVTLTVLMLWLFNCIVNKYRSKASFVLVVGLLLISIFVSFGHYQNLVERIAFWILLFTAFGAVQALFEHKYTKI